MSGDDERMTAAAFHEHLVSLALQAYDAAPSVYGSPSKLSYDRDDFEDRVRERMAQAATVYAIDHEPGPRFAVTCADRLYTLSEMEAANADDLFTRDWLNAAEVGEVLDPYHGEKAMRVR